VTTVESWARRAATLPGALVTAQPRAVTAGAEVLEGQARANLVAATGGDRRLSGVSSMRARRGRGGTSNREVDVTVRTRGAGRRAEAVVVPRGPVSLVEKPTKPHRIPLAFTINARRNVARRAVHVPGVGVFASVRHPGTRGKRPVGRAFDSHAPEAARAGLEVFARATRDHLTG
jgi:hypothetical protein